jgi:quercetin dioxygenase-like cupin family protein
MKNLMASVSQLQKTGKVHIQNVFMQELEKMGERRNQRNNRGDCNKWYTLLVGQDCTFTMLIKKRKEIYMNKLIFKGTVFAAADTIEYSEGGIISKQVLKNEAGNISLFSFDKGQGLSEHTAPFDAVVQVLEGEAQITIGGTRFSVRKNESIIMPAKVPHALLADERFKMLLTMIKG